MRRLLFLAAVLGSVAISVAWAQSTTDHGGVVVTGMPTVLIEGRTAARISDLQVCPLVAPGPIPHVGGPIQTGQPTVIIGGLEAATVGSLAACVGPPATLSTGAATVFIGSLPAGQGA